MLNRNGIIMWLFLINWDFGLMLVDVATVVFVGIWSSKVLFSKQNTRLVQADLRITRAGVLIADLPQSYPSSRVEATLVMTDTWPSALSQGFLNSPF